MNNVVLDTIMARRTVRAYKDEQISKEQLDALCKTALISPTAMNSQNWHFAVIQDKALLTELEADVVAQIMASGNESAIERTKSRNNKVIYNAPTLIVVSAEPTKYAPIDAGIAVQSLALAAKSMELDSVILGMVGVAFEGDKADYWKEKMNFPKNHKIVISIAIGYGDMTPADRELDTSKLTVI